MDPLIVPLSVGLAAAVGLAGYTVFQLHRSWPALTQDVPVPMGTAQEARAAILKRFGVEQRTGAEVNRTAAVKADFDPVSASGAAWYGSDLGRIEGVLAHATQHPAGHAPARSARVEQISEEIVMLFKDKHPHGTVTMGRSVGGQDGWATTGSGIGQVTILDDGSEVNSVHILLVEQNDASERAVVDVLIRDCPWRDRSET